MRQIAGHEIGLTKQRRVVLEVIRESPEHLTANEVFVRAQSKFQTISFATDYNSHRLLRPAGNIAEINFGNGASRYDRITRRHDHAICTECGMLVDIELEQPVDLIEIAAAYSKFKPESLEFTLKGLCPECSDKGRLI